MGYEDEVPFELHEYTFLNIHDLGIKQNIGKMVSKAVSAWDF